jgi:hypothetical protein
LFGFFAVGAIALGAGFFVVIQRLTSAGWSVTVRRTAEFLIGGLPAIAVLAIPVLWSMHNISPMMVKDSGHHASIPLVSVANADLAPSPAASAAHADPHAAAPHGQPAASAPADHAADHGAAPHADEHAGAHPKGHAAGHADHDPLHVQHAETLAKKSAWFAPNFFYGRGLVYLAIWALLGITFFNFSVKQDKSKDPALTVRAQAAAPVFTALLGLSVTFAAFDWVMALEPSWFSTIFGVYVFANCLLSALAAIILITMSLRDAGYLKDVVTREHYHDLGKLLFGFTCFWTYIAFSQFMLIWYAALPEETIFYHMRWDSDKAPWWALSLLLCVGHFVFPFFLLMSRHAKRSKLHVLKFGATWLLVMHCVDWYWLIMPNLMPVEYSFHWLDVTCLLAVGGLYFGYVFRQMTLHALIPVGDPRLLRSIHFQNA